MRFAKNSQPKNLLILGVALTWAILGCAHCSLAAETPPFLKSAKQILFLGDSITHAGHYISQLEAQIRLRNSGQAPEMINLGLPSETCSGLSEPDHPFPRPDVHERLDRALAKVKPDVVVACYGMNDGIYYPFDETRFAAYQAGINGLIKKVHATGAKLVLVTPPAFDPLPLRKQGKLRPEGAEKYAWFAIYENYDDVMKGYAAWIMKQGDRVAMVIDVHTPVNEYVAQQRKTNAGFTLSGDGVHINAQGHRILSSAILAAWGMGQPLEVSPEISKQVEQRQRLLHDAWLSHVGHKRPGMKPGLPLAEVQSRAKQIDASLSTLLGSKQP